MSEWNLVNGPCSCCGDAFQRCVRGEDARVLETESGEKRILCSHCYSDEKHDCDYLPEGDAPVEVDRVTGSRKVIDGCLNCYYHYYPCGQCRGKEEVMTYAEFRWASVRRRELPEKYEDFLSDKENTQPYRHV